MLTGKPILAGESDNHQLDIIFDLVGTPTEQTMPGWKQLPGAEGLIPRPRPPSLPQRFREHGPQAVSLLTELMLLDWRARLNAHDALEHPYFKSAPYPARPEDIPTFEDSHELDRRKFHDRRAALPPAPQGGTVGVAAFEGSNASFGAGDGYGHRGGGGGRHHNNHHRDRRDMDVNGRRPTWAREQPRHEHRLPPRPPPPENGWDSHGDSRAPPRSRGPPGGPPPPATGGRPGPDVDTYIPAYGDRPPPRSDRPPRGGPDDRAPPPRKRDDRDDMRRHDWDRRDRDRDRDRERDRDRDRDRDREMRDYDSGGRSRASRTRSRSRSPPPPPRGGDPRERDVYRR